MRLLTSIISIGEIHVEGEYRGCHCAPYCLNGPGRGARSKWRISGAAPAAPAIEASQGEGALECPRFGHGIRRLPNACLSEPHVCPGRSAVTLLQQPGHSGLSAWIAGLMS